MTCKVQTGSLKSCAQEANQEHWKLCKWIKKTKSCVGRLLNVATAYPKPAEYTKSNMMELCSREKLSVEEVFYFIVFGLLIMYAYVFGIIVVCLLVFNSKIALILKALT